MTTTAMTDIDLVYHIASLIETEKRARDERQRAEFDLQQRLEAKE